jgi:hypothetical protein
LTFQEWKTDLEKWFDYNWENKYGTPKKMPSHTRFELLHPAFETPKHGTTTDVGDEQVDPVWMKADFPHGPWHDDSSYTTAAYPPPLPGSGEWMWGDFMPRTDLECSQWTYVFDLDRDAFTINSAAHFRLSNMPEGLVRYLRNGSVLKLKNLPDEHLAPNIYPGPPDIDPELVDVYNAVQVSIMDAPTISNHPKHLMLFNFLKNMRYQFGSDSEFVRKWLEWGPSDRQMQRLVWSFVRYAMWDGLAFVKRNRQIQWDEGEHPPTTIPMPTESDYYVLVGTNKILISLATNLGVEDIAKMAVAKVINLTPEGTVQLACVISLHEMIIVNIDKSSPQVCVSRTGSLAFAPPQSDGVKALVATFSPLSHPILHLPNNGILPVETVEHFFKLLVLTGGVTTVPNFACACKLFSEIVRCRTVKVGRCMVLNFPMSRRGVFFGLGEKRSVELFRLQWDGNEEEKVTRPFKILADGVNIGFEIVDLVSV